MNRLVSAARGLKTVIQDVIGYAGVGDPHYLTADEESPEPHLVLVEARLGDHTRVLATLTWEDGSGPDDASRRVEVQLKLHVTDIPAWLSATSGVVYNDTFSAHDNIDNFVGWLCLARDWHEGRLCFRSHGRGTRILVADQRFVKESDPHCAVVLRREDDFSLRQTLHQPPVWWWHDTKGHHVRGPFNSLGEALSVQVGRPVWGAGGG